MADGKDEYQALLDAGFSVQEADEWKKGIRQELTDGGFTDYEIREHFGEPDPNDDSGLAATMASNRKELWDESKAEQADGSDFFEMMGAGWNMSASSLMTGAPEVVRPQKTSLLGELGYGVGQIVGDLPFTVAGFAGGAAGGGAVGGAGGSAGGPLAFVTGTGGAVIGAGAGSAALPEVVRQMYMDSYRNGTAATWGEFADRSAAIAFNTSKAAVIGGATAGIGGVAARPVLARTGSMAAAVTTNTAAQAVGGTALAAGLEGKIPDQQDVTAATILAIGFQAAGSVVGATQRFAKSAQGMLVSRNLEEVHVATGLNPWDVADMATKDLGVQQELHSETASGDPYIGPILRGAALDEPQPYKPKPDLAKTDPEFEAAQAEAKAKGVELDPPKQLTQADWDTGNGVGYSKFLDSYMDPKSGRMINAEEVTNMTRFLERSEAAAKRQGVSPHAVVSPAGAIGLYQIMPATAKAFGVSREQLFDPQINKRVAIELAKELLNRPKYKLPDGSPDVEAILADYNGGPRAANAFLKNRNLADLNAETRGYIQRAREAGFVTGNWVKGNDGKASKINVDGIKPFKPDFGAYLNARDITSRVGKDKIITPSPNTVASYMESFGREAGFKFVVGPEQVTIGGADQPSFVRSDKDSFVYMPDTPEATTRRWYGLGRAEILMHEAGHAIHRNVLGDKKVDAAIRSEAEAVSRQFRPQLWSEDSTYNSTQAELMADAVAVWISRPDLRKEMPAFAKAFEEELAPYVFFAERNLPVKEAQKARGGGDKEPPKGGEPPKDAAGAGGGGKPPGPPNDTSVGPAGQPPEGDGPKFPLTAEMLEAKISDSIATPKQQSLITGAKDLLASQIRGIFSELEPFRQMDTALKKGDKFFGLEDAFRMTYSSQERAHSFMTRGVVQLAGKTLTNDASLQKALTQAKDAGGTRNGFIAYMIARRTLEKAAQGKENLTPFFTPEEAQAYVKMTGKNYESAAGTMRTMFHGLLDYQVDAGLLSAKGAAKIKADNQYYIPFRRHITDDATLGLGGAGFQGRKTAKMLEGSDRQLVEPMEATLEYIAASVAMADRNVAIRSLTDAKDYGKLAGAVLTDERPVNEVTMPDGTKVKLDANEPIPPDAFVAVGLEQGRKMVGKNEFIAYKNGVGQVWTVKDKGLAEVIRGISPDQAGWITQALQWPAMIQRRGITDTPDFIIRSIIRESIGASILFKDAGFPMQNFFEGFWGVFWDTPGFQQFAREGGLGASLSDMDRNVVQVNMDKLFTDTGVKGHVTNAAGSVLEGLHILMQRTDAMGRYGYYKKLAREGTSPEKAAMKARTSRLDFREKGTMKTVQYMASIVPFLRPRLLGWRQLAQQVGTDPGGVAFRAAAFVTLPSIALYFLNAMADEDREPDDPKRWENIPQWVKDTHWIVPLPGDGQMRIPKPFEPGYVFGTTAERFLDYSMGKDPDAIKEWGEGLLRQVFIDPTPAAVKPIVEHITNHSFFTGRPLIHPSVEQASGYLQFTPATTETAKALSELLGAPGLDLLDVSPIVLENYVRGYAGTLGVDMLKLFDMTAETVGLSPAKARDWSDIPFLKSFAVRTGMSAQPIADFYDLYGEFQRVQKDMSLGKARGDTETMMRAASNPMARVKMQETAKALSNMRMLIDQIQRDESMLVTEKRQAIDQLSRHAIGIATTANEIMLGVQEETE